MPVVWSRSSDAATMSLVRGSDEELLFARGDTLAAYDSFVAVQQGDFFDPLRSFSTYMQRHRGKLPGAVQPVLAAAYHAHLRLAGFQYGRRLACMK